MRSALLVFWLTLTLAAVRVRARGEPTHEVVIRAASEADARAHAADHGYEYVDHIVGDNYRLRGTSTDHTQLRAVAELYELPTLERKTRIGDPWSYTQATDPEFAHQWSLTGSTRTLPARVHLNVTAAWGLGAIGRGMVVAVVDDGAQPNHMDIVGAIDANRSYAVRGGSYAHLGSDSHGSACASVIAGTPDDGFCGVGIAHGARVVVVRYLGVPSNEADEAIALSRGCDAGVGVWSCSWGPNDYRPRIEGPGRVVREAMEHCITHGRDGLGVVYLWAGGNGREAGDNANFDGYANSRYTIAVGAYTATGGCAYYSELGTNILVSAPSSGALYGITAARADTVSTSRCRDDFSGTSAAAPAVAGVVALVLEANPSLSWRDVQHILVQSAQVAMRRARAETPRVLQCAEAAWVRNAVGLEHSDGFGFGPVNAGLAVRRALTWNPLAPERKRSVDVDVGSGRVEKGGRTWSVEVAASEDTPQALETVELEVYVSAAAFYDLRSLELTSPGGTTSRLVRANNKIERELHWRFTTVKCWGESPVGTWSVRADVDAVVEFETVALHMYGI